MAQTMFAAETFDPRPMWNAAAEQERACGPHGARYVEAEFALGASTVARRAILRPELRVERARDERQQRSSQPAGPLAARALSLSGINLKVGRSAKRITRRRFSNLSDRSEWARPG